MILPLGDFKKMFQDIFRLQPQSIMEELVRDILFGTLYLRRRILCKIEINIPKKYQKMKTFSLGHSVWIHCRGALTCHRNN